MASGTNPNVSLEASYKLFIKGCTVESRSNSFFITINSSVKKENHISPPHHQQTIDKSKQIQNKRNYFGLIVFVKGPNTKIYNNEFIKNEKVVIALQ